MHYYDLYYKHFYLDLHFSTFSSENIVSDVSCHRLLQIFQSGYQDVNETPL